MESRIKTHNQILSELAGNRTLGNLEERIGYAFADRTLLVQALMHSSYAHETGAADSHLLCNERMEFLGDSILSFVTSEYLYDTFPTLPEGKLSKLRSGMVCGEALSSYASGIGLGTYLYLGVGEQKNRENPTILENAFEALIAAIWLDSGRGEKGIGAVRSFVLPFLKSEMEELRRFNYTKDYKSLLQQLTQQQDGNLPEYRTVGDTGLPGPERYTVEVYLNSNKIGQGKGPKVQKAEVQAAREALVLFGLVNRNETS
ncbi:MAG: ribonuclease III [Clostridia bacterium]|nr:ribonuclease III [Clostridia bacterium]